MPLDPLEAFIDETIAVSMKHGYTPTEFIQMRQRLGTVRTIKKLVVSGELQAGFKKLKRLDLLDWSIEKSVINFPEYFTAEEVQAARSRLDWVKQAD